MKFNINIKGKSKTIDIKEDLGEIKIKVGKKEFCFKKNRRKEKISVAQTNIPKKNFSKKEIKAPIAGTISKIFVEAKQSFKKNQKIISLSAMKMENEIVSDFKGIIREVMVSEGQKVKEGDVLVTIK